jgi:hypothetical protein
MYRPIGAGREYRVVGNQADYVNPLHTVQDFGAGEIARLEEALSGSRVEDLLLTWR